MKRCLYALLVVGLLPLGACSGGSNGPVSLGIPVAGVRHLNDVLYNFQAPPDAELAYAGLATGKKGEFYGTTYGGGTGPSGGDGTVYEITAAGKEKVLYSFQYGSDGAGSQAVVISDKTGALYGESVLGGGGSACAYGCGTVFKLTPGKSGFTESVLYPFAGAPNDGALPYGGLLMTKSGALLGTTFQGGSSKTCGHGCGTVFELTPSGSKYSENVIHVFGNNTDADGPADQLVADSSGNLYGTSLFGGNVTGACKKGPLGLPGCGTVFKLTPSGSTYSESVIYRFAGSADGKYPRSSVLLGANGVLYGLTEQGGAKKGSENGTVFELTPKGSRYSEKILYSFQGGSDGADPDDTPGLVAASGGGFYGTTVNGGGASACASGCGTIFKLSPSGSGYTESVLYAFQGGTDGEYPYGSVTVDGKGQLLGPTYYGGSGPCSFSSNTGCGTIFSVKP